MPSSEAADPIGLVRGIKCTDKVISGTSHLKGYKITVPSPGYNELLEKAFETNTVSSLLQYIPQVRILQAEILSSVIVLRYWDSS